MHHNLIEKRILCEKWLIISQKTIYGSIIRAFFPFLYGQQRRKSSKNAQVYLKNDDAIDENWLDPKFFVQKNGCVDNRCELAKMAEPVNWFFLSFFR